MTKPTNADLDANGGLSMHELLDDVRKTMPAGSFSFALAWMRKGLHIRRRSYPQVTYWIENMDTDRPVVVCSRDVDIHWTTFSSEYVLATDWEAVP